MPWLVAVGITTSLSNNSIEQLKLQVICTDLLGPQIDSGVPVSFTSVFEGVRALVPVEECKTEAVIGFVALVQGRIGAILGIFSFLMTSLALGNILGTILGGYISRATGDLTVVIKISLVSTALLAIYLSVLPESLKTTPLSLSQWMRSQTDKDHSADGDSLSTRPKKAASIVQSLKRAYCLFRANISTIFDPLLLFVPGRVPKTENMATAYTPALIILGCFFVGIGISVFHWGEYENSIYSAFSFAFKFITFLVIFPVLQLLYKRVISNPQKSGEEAAAQPLMLDANESQDTSPKSSEQSGIDAIRMDLVFTVGGMGLLIIAHLLVPTIPTVPVFYFSGALASVGQIATVTGISLLSSVMPDQLTGAAVGALTVVTSLGAIVSDITYGLLLSLTVKTFPLLYYFVSAALSALAFAIATINWWSYRRK
ncbi:hypothetical protein BGW39_009691 [Mortierella sp. 14UC]|nr:hypothetical protein BGW39_009691 [Mortierella sp. 14UC]